MHGYLRLLLMIIDKIVYEEPMKRNIGWKLMFGLCKSWL